MTKMHTGLIEVSNIRNKIYNIPLNLTFFVRHLN
jgi:hypothetical protein